ncbi:MAG: class A beta-lactamase-related serine hydrolase [Alishewanella sp.]|nr:class A beta-lactamase-related serine hydrolase [Alishewanella sp.]MDP5187410.1 class A beta-lactamase-related serine hydrolase [Alishewanella sp.]
MPGFFISKFYCCMLFIQALIIYPNWCLMINIEELRSAELKIFFYIFLTAAMIPHIAFARSDVCQHFTAAESCQSLLPLLEQSQQKLTLLDRVFADSQSYKLQIIFTRIESPMIEGELPKLHYYHYGVQPDRYFYPASTVKLPLVALAMQWLNEQTAAGITLDTIMLTDALHPSQSSAYTDVTSESGLPSVGHYIKKILLVSDNDSSNRLYELLGQQYINQQLQAKGLTSTVINHRLSVPFTDDDNRFFNPIRFIDPIGKTLLAIPQRQVAVSYRNTDQPKLGLGYFQHGQLVNQPMDFTLKNRQSLLDLDGVVKRLVMPELFPEEQRFNITEPQRQFILRYMRMLPRQSEYPKYSEEQYTDTYVKYLLKSDDQLRLPEYIHYHNKNGQAYGHVIDAAFINDTKYDVSYFLSAIIYTNANQILNDDIYETETLGQPFLRELGHLLYQQELDAQQATNDTNNK